jgi:hypothetical protein
MGIPSSPPPSSLNNPNPSLSRRVSFPEAGGEPGSGKREILRITCSDGLQKGWRYIVAQHREFLQMQDV